jgi:acyl dehydratase
VSWQIERALTPPDGVTERYAHASGDDNPIHVDDAAARAAGLPGRILHGLWSMAQLARIAQDAVGADPWALTELAVEFRGYADLESPVAFRGSVAVDGRATVELEAFQAGRRVLGAGRAELEIDPSVLHREAT